MEGDVAEPRVNSQAARLESFLRAATRAGLTVYGVEIGKRGLRILTQPGELPPPKMARATWIAR